MERKKRILYGKKHSLILNLLLTGDFSLSKISEILGPSFSKISTYLLIQDLVHNNFVQLRGTGRSSVYSLTDFGCLFGSFDKQKYFDLPEIDTR